jgi:hypothetical protein
VLKHFIAKFFLTVPQSLAIHKCNRNNQEITAEPRSTPRTHNIPGSFLHRLGALGGSALICDVRRWQEIAGLSFSAV